ncbi:hypothetical protein ES707_08608 [subsurface metagenome]
MNKPSANRLATAILEEATLRRCPGAYVATGYSSDNISILHQQVRAANLSWALARLNTVKHGSVVAIVGGSFSGLMIAVSLAVQRRCIVHIYEKADRLLDRFRNSHSRFISVNLNSRDLPPRFDPSYSPAIYKPPIFAWSEGTASEVAHRWLREFQTYYAHLPIFLVTGAEVVGCRRPSDDKIELTIRGKRGSKVEHAADVVVFAVGFGNEQNRLSIEDWSYWNSGSALQYRPGLRTARKERVLISGCGDSGVVELMHYVFRDFRHEHISNFYPTGCGIESFVQPMLEQSNFWSIRYSHEIAQFDGAVISELAWFFTRKYLVDYNPSFEDDVMRGLRGQKRTVELLYRQIYARAAALLGQQLKRRILPYRSGDDVACLEDLLRQVPPDAQLFIRNELKFDISRLASAELDLNMREVDPSHFFDLKAYRERRLDRFEIWMNDVTPTMYTDALSPANLIFLRLCQCVEDIRFVQGQLKSVTPRAGGYDVRFAGGRRMIFERVATRYGTSHDEATRSILGRPPRKMHFGDRLLEPPIIMAESEPDESGTGTVRREDAAFSAIARAASAASHKACDEPKNPLLSKQLYVGALWVPKIKEDFKDLIHSDPQGWLSRRLKRGGRVNYLQSDGLNL